jgi:hypothetical protein
MDSRSRAKGQSVKTQRQKTRAAKALSRVWLPVVVIGTVVIIGGAVRSVQGMSESLSHPPITATIPATIVQINPKTVTYQLFGSLGNRGSVVYADLNSQPIQVSLMSLPWSHSETTMAAAATLSLVAQIDGGSLGCRILVDGQVHDEHVVSHDSAAVACTVTAA